MTPYHVENAARLLKKLDILQKEHLAATRATKFDFGIPGANVEFAIDKAGPEEGEALCFASAMEPIIAFMRRRYERVERELKEMGVEM